MRRSVTARAGPGPAASPRIVALCRLAIAVAAPRPGRLDEAIAQCRGASGLRSDDVVEAILQAVPYSGIPGAVEALTAWRSGSTSSVEPKRAPLPPPSCAAETGARIFAEVYGNQAARVRTELARLHPVLSSWVIEFAYGTVMGRGALPLHDLEALGVASLLGQGRRVPLRSHVRGALRTGWQPVELRALLVELASWCDPEIVAHALDLASAPAAE